MTRDLTDALLRLEALLVREGAAIVPALHEGIDESEVASLLEGIGLVPTPEFVAWFGWHNGAGRPGMSSRVIEIVPGGEFYDLSYLHGECIRTRTVAAEIAAMPGVPFDAEQRWPTSWFPLLRLVGKGFLAVDLAGDDGSASPVHVAWHDDDPERRARVAWPSIAAFVEAVIERFEDGTYAVGDDGIVRGPTLDLPD